jgi:hypothetical protein
MNHENRDGTFTANVGVVSSADRLQIQAMTDRGLSITLVDKLGLASDHESFTLPGEIRLCATAHSELSLLSSANRCLTTGRSSGCV